LACNPPAAIREALGDVLLRIASIEVPSVRQANDLHVVYFEVPRGHDGAELQCCLNKLAPALASALAKRFLLALAPQLQFAPHHGETGGQLVARPPLWHVARRERRATVHAAMRSWQANMHF